MFCVFFKAARTLCIEYVITCCKENEFRSHGFHKGLDRRPLVFIIRCFVLFLNQIKKMSVELDMKSILINRDCYLSFHIAEDSCLMTYKANHPIAHP